MAKSIENPFDSFYDDNLDLLKSVQDARCSLDRRTPDLTESYDSDFILVEFPNLSPFHRALHRVSERFDYLSTSEERWETDYVLPDALSQWTDKFNWSESDDPTIINSSSDEIKKWFLKVCNFASPKNSWNSKKWLRAFLTGEVGCGKSTFIKRGIKQNRQLFISERVIPARVEFSKIGRSTMSADETPFEELRSAVVDSMYREIHHFFCDTQKQKSFVHHDDFKEFRMYVVDTYMFSAVDTDLDNLKERAEQFADYHIAKAARFVNLPRADKKFEVHNSDALFKEIAIHYTHNLIDYNFLIIFDGFDYLSAADYLFKTKDSDRIHQLNIFYKGSAEFTLLSRLKSPLDFHQVFVMRDITYGRFFKRRAGIDEFDERSHYRILSPGSKALVARAIARVCEECNLPNLSSEAWEFDKYIRKLLREGIIKGDIGDMVDRPTSGSLKPITVFNGNARKELAFLTLILEFLVLEIVADPKSPYADSPRELFKIINDSKFRRELRVKQYRLLALLLCRNRSAFRNSLALPDLDHSTENIFDFEGLGNFIDNLFNYDESNQQPCALLSKIRVCELLREEPLSLIEIEESLGPIYCKNYERLIAVMCRTGLLKSRFKNGEVYFQTEAVGITCIDHLIHKTEYIEHVFPHISLPKKLRERSLRAYDRSRVSSRFWARASMVNSFLLMKYIQEVESQERKAFGDRWDWVFPRIKSHHAETCVRTLKKFSSSPSNRKLSEEFSDFLKELNSNKT